MRFHLTGQAGISDPKIHVTATWIFLFPRDFYSGNNRVLDAKSLERFFDWQQISNSAILATQYAIAEILNLLKRLMVWCPGRGLNPHGAKRLEILSLVCLPVSPPGP